MGLPLTSVGGEASTQSSARSSVFDVPDKVLPAIDCRHNIRASLIGSTA